MRSHEACAAVLAVLLVAACSSGEGRWTGTVTDSAGIAIVSNPTDGVWTSSNRWTLEEELRIGTIEGNPEYQFGQIGFIAVDSHGRLFVIDAQAQHVRVFSSDGQYEQTIGRPGSGPGELGPQAISLYMGPGDTLLIPDLGNQRVNRYAPDGSSIGSFRLEFEKGLPMAINATRSGAIAVQLRPLALPDQPARDSMDAIVILATDGSVTDTLMKFPSGGTLNLGGRSPEVRLFSPEPVWQITDDLRLCFGVNNEYRIGLYSPEGTLERIITKPFELTPIGQRDQDMVMGFFEEAWRDAGLPPAAIARARSIIHFAEFYPAYAGIQIGPQGSIWVQHIQSPSGLTEEELESWNFIEDIGSPDWDVFDQEGRFLGVVTMPHRFAARAFVENKIYGVWRDELDVQYAVRLRIIGVGGDDTGAVPLGTDG